MKYRYEKLPTPCRAKKNNLAPALHLELPMTSWIFAEFTSVIFAYFLSLIFQSLTKSSPLIPFKHFFWRDSLIGVMSLVPHFFKNLRHQYLHLEMHVTITTVYMYLNPPSYLLFSLRRYLWIHNKYFYGTPFVPLLFHDELVFFSKENINLLIKSIGFLYNILHLL
jgi:hypothetical protein